MVKKGNKKNKFYFPLIVLLLVGILWQLCYQTYTYKQRFFSKGYEKQYIPLKNAYYESQYAKKNATAIMPDEIFEQFAAGAFLKGMNPIHIVHDHPPLGRYILSLSIILFDNPHTIIIPFLLMSLLGVFLIAKLVLKDAILSLIPVLIFANEPLFVGKILYSPLPEPIQEPFIIFAVYVFLLAINSKKKTLLYSLVSILLGFIISIRFFVTGGVLLTAMIILLGMKRDIKQMIVFILTLPLSIVVLLLSYTVTMQQGYSIIQIFGVQKYILAYHKSAFTHAFSFWDLILFNRWHTWWGEEKILSDSQWIIIWPISVAASFVQLVLFTLKKLKLSDAEKLLYLWLLGYCLMLSTGYTSTRYFFPILPFFYILLVSAVLRFYRFYKNAKISFKK